MKTITKAVAKARKGLPKRLAEIRGDESQRAFARRLGVFQQNINRYEHGVGPHLDFLIHLNQVERINLNWLLTGKGRIRVNS